MVVSLRCKLEEGTVMNNITAPAVSDKTYTSMLPNIGIVYCIDCRHLEITGCYGQCGRGYLGIVRPDDFCSRGERREIEK